MWCIRLFPLMAFACISVLLSQGAVANDRANCEGEDLAARLVSCTRLIVAGKIRGKELAYAYENRGMGYVMLGDVDRGLKDFDKAIVLHPELATAYLNRGYAFVFKENLSEAQANFKRAMKAKPDWAEPYVGRAILYYMSGLPQNAIADLTKAISIDPLDAQAHLNRGVLFREQGQIAKATIDFKMAVSLDPFNKAARQQLKELFVKPDIEHRLPSGRVGALAIGQTLKVGRGNNSIQCTVRRRKAEQQKYACMFAKNSD